MSGIEIFNLNKKWTTFQAVNDVSFTVEPGTMTVLLGPSGCGKSTTLRLIAGLDSVDSGSIHIGGKDVTHAPPAKRDLAMVFQSYALFPHLNVRENILFGLKVRRVPAAERNRRLSNAIDILGLGALLDRKPSQLSGGQQQRVALGRAIVAQARVCLMDEPLSNLDAQLRHEMRKEIRNIQRALDMTMVYVTHDQIEAMSLADQVILMCNGQIEQKATPAQLYAQPATAFAARFIGTPPMNLISLADGPSGAIIKGSTGPALFEGRGNGFHLGLRPEQLRISEGDSSGNAMVEAIVRSTDYHGADSIIECAVGEEILFVRVEGARAYHAGERVTLSWAGAAMHVFDCETTQRVDRMSLIGEPETNKRGPLGGPLPKPIREMASL